MKRKGWTKGVSLLLTAAMLLGLTGCGSTAGGNVSQLDKEHVYSYESLELPENLEEIRSIKYLNDKIYLLGSKYEQQQTFYLCSMNKDGSDAKANKLVTGYEMAPEAESEAVDDEAGAIEPRTLVEEAVEEEVAVEEAVTDDLAVEYPETGAYSNTYVWINSAVIDENANVYGVVEVSIDSMDETGNYVYEQKMLLYCWNEQGEIQWSADLKEGRSEDEYFYVSNMFSDKEGTLWLYGNSEMLTYDKQGNKKNQKKLGEEVNGNLYMDKAGKLLLVSWNNDYTKQTMREVDKNTLELLAEQEFPSILNNYVIYQDGNVFDFVLCYSNSVYGYNMGDAEPKELMDLVDSDLYSYGLNSVCLIDEEHILGTYNDPDDWKSIVAFFTKVQPEDVKEKTPITLAAMYLSGDVKKRVIDFNKSNDTYRIQINEYNQYSTMDDYMAGYTKLNNDIVAGKIPDILVVDEAMPFDSYVAKGLITDLYTLMENDEEIKKEDFSQNIMDAFSADGKLYRLVPGYRVSGVFGKTSIVGDRTGWNMQEFQELMTTMPEETQSFSEMTRDGMIYMGLMFANNDYIDKNTGKCSFDSPEFIEFLEFVSTFPKEIDYTIYEDENYWEEMEGMYRENRAILLNRYISTYADFNRMEKGEFGEEVTAIGFPTASKNGNVILADSSYAISAKSKCQEGAWEFLRYYLLDEYQEELEYAFPIKKSALEKQAAEAMERPYWINDDGTKEYYDDTYYIDGVEVIIEPMTQQEVDEFTAFLNSLTMVGGYNQSIQDIVTEEAEPFFEGQKSAQEVAKIIQSRAQLYISESR